MFTMEIINYTKDEVHYFEGWHQIEGKLEQLQAKNPGHEIGVSHFEICGVEIPYTEENIDFINSHDTEEIEAVVVYYENEYGVDPTVDLQSVADYMEDRANVTFFYADDELDAFAEYCATMGYLANVPDYLETYIDYEKWLLDCKLDGMGVYRLSYDRPTNYRFMFCD